MSANLVDPYQPPSQQEEYDQKVIDLLLLHKRKQQVVKVLREDGQSHKSAKLVVDKHTAIAQSLLNRKYIAWMFMGGLLFVIATFIVAVMAHFSNFRITLILALLVVAYGSFFCFQKREVIM